MSTEASDRDLKNSFDRLVSSAGSCDPAVNNLLRFYAVECGLKCAIMRQRGLRSTSQLDDDLRSHDLVKLAKALHLPGTNVSELRAMQSRGRYVQWSFDRTEGLTRGMAIRTAAG